MVYVFFYIVSIGIDFVTKLTYPWMNKKRSNWYFGFTARMIFHSSCLSMIIGKGFFNIKKCFKYVGIILRLEFKFNLSCLQCIKFLIFYLSK